MNARALSPQLAAVCLALGACGADDSSSAPGSGRGSGGAEAGPGGSGGAATAGGSAGEASGGSGGSGGAAIPPGDASACGALPNSGVYAMFRSGPDVFHVWITKPGGITHAIDLWKGQSTAKIPSGSLDCTTGTFNCPWSWRMKPDTVDFADITIEVCDGLPSYVQANCSTFGNGTYCPWNAELTELRDCRADAGCPMVPR